MVSRTHLVENMLNSNGLTDSSYTANSYPSYLLIVLQKILFRKKKKYFRNNIICGSFYQRYCLILPFKTWFSTHYFHKESSKSSISVIVMQSELPSVNLWFIFFLKKNWHGFNFIRRNTSFWLIIFMQFNFFLAISTLIN
jgi:hypothetical protein